MNHVPAIRALLALALLGAGPGCSLVVGSATSRLAGDMTTAVLEQNDLLTVRDGAPAYLLALDGLIEGQPTSQPLLLAGAQLYGAYASAFVVDDARLQRLTERSRSYALRALCERSRSLCESVERPYDDFVAQLETVRTDGVPALYGFGVAWSGWVQARSADWVAVAEIPKIEAIMRHVADLDPDHADGGVYLYLGVLATLRPPLLGGKPEEGRAYFERAIELSNGDNQMAKVLMASQYAKLVFDRELHDRLLNEVLAADPEASGLTLTNMLAREQAEELLADADEYF